MLVTFRCYRMQDVVSLDAQPPDLNHLVPLNVLNARNG